MPKQIKLMDSVAEKLAERAEADGLTLAGEVSKLLGGGADSSDVGSVLDKLDYLEGYLDKKFEELKSFFASLKVEQMAGQGGSGRAPGGKEWVKWAQMSYIIFNREDDDPAWILPEGAVFSFKNGDPDDLAYYVKDGTIYIDGPQPVALLKVTPDIREAIDKNFTFED